MRFDKQEETENIEIEVRKGKIGQTDTYKYLGDHYNETGSNVYKIRKKMEKAKYMAYEVKRMGGAKKVGKAATGVRLMLMEITIKPMLLANTETWCKVGKLEEDEWKKWQYKILTIIMEQKKGTPYWGIIAETGTWPYQYIVQYKMFMFVHNLVNSDERRIARKVLIEQSKIGGNNYTTTTSKQRQKN